MSRAISIDLRERIIKGIKSGMTVRAVASQYQVGVSSVVKIHQLYRKTGSLVPGKVGGRDKRTLEEHRDYILSAVEKEPHITVRKLRDLLGAKDIHVCHTTVWNFLRREGLSHKKKPVRQ